MKSVRLTRRSTVLSLAVLVLSSLVVQMAMAGPADELPAHELPVDEGVDAAKDLLRAPGPYTKPVRKAAAAQPKESLTPSPGKEHGGGSSTMAFLNHPAPETIRNAHAALEPSIGVDLRANDALLLMNTTVAKVAWDDTVFPPVASWSDVSPTVNVPATLDPILWTDRSTGRTFLNQLLGEVSFNAVTDDGGATWQTTQPATAAPSFDHQTIGAGPYPPGAAGGLSYPNAVYYCAQAGLHINTGKGFNSASQCARSDTGGLTWGAPLPMNLFDCAGLHGKVVVGRDGAVYVPHKDCYDAAADRRAQGVLVSRDGGVTWDLSIVPGTDPSEGDPAVAVDAGNRLYFLGGQRQDDGGLANSHPVTATSADGGRTWSAVTDVGAPFSLRNSEFDMAIAGDAGRAAVAFLGTPTAGDGQDANFDGEWHLYVASTFDGGQSWTTVDATPTDPVQRGCIWMGGGSNPCRNLLDFATMTVDAEGRVMVGYADGCTGRCVQAGASPAQSRDRLGTIARQVVGQRLLAAFDTEGPDVLHVSAGGPYRTRVGTPVLLTASALGGTGRYRYSWDLDGDGGFDDARGASVEHTPTEAGTRTIAVRVADRSMRAYDSAELVVEPAAGPERTLHDWSFDNGESCNTQGWTTFTVAADFGTDLPSVQTAKWHLRAKAPSSAPCAWYHGIDVLELYPDQQYTVLRSPCIALTDAVSAAIEFGRAGVLEQGADGTQYDFLTVEAAPCGVTASQSLAKFGGAAGDLDAEPAVYQRERVDLSAFAGSSVQVWFVIRSDLVVEERGYQIDDVRIAVS